MEYRGPSVVYGCALMLLLAVLTPRPLLAEPLCGLLQTLGSIEMASQQIRSTSDHGVAARQSKTIRAALHRLADLPLTPGAQQGGSGGGGSVALAINEFIRSRGRLVDIFRTDGLKAAHEYIREPDFTTRWNAVANLERRGDCDAAATPDQPADTATAERSSSGSAELRGSERLSRIGMPLGGIFTLGPIYVPFAFLVFAFCGLLIANWADRREHKRYSCKIPTQMRIGDIVEKGWIMNISRGGAMLKLVNRLAPGTRGEILLNGALHEVKVSWANPNFLGVRFTHELRSNPRSLARLNELA